MAKNNFQQIFNVIKYFKNNFSNVLFHLFIQTIILSITILNILKILSKTNCKLKRYRIFSIQIQSNEKITFEAYLKLYDIFTSLLLASTFISNVITVKVTIPLDLFI